MNTPFFPEPRLLARRIFGALVSALLRLRSRRLPLAADGPTVIIAPHQDDETLGCGGLLALIGRTARVEIIYITDGQGSHPGHPTLTPAALGRQRRSEALTAMAGFGLMSSQLHFLEAPDGTLNRLSPPVTAALIDRLAARLAAIHPARIFIPCGQDGSSEHEAAYVLLTRALAALPSSPTCLEFPVWSRWNPRFLLAPACRSRRVWRLNFPRHIAEKRHALAAYVSQTEPTAPWIRAVLSPEFLGFFSSDVEYFFER